MPNILPLALLVVATALAATETPYPEPTPSPLAGLDYPLSLYPDGADHDPRIPPPSSELGFGVGQRVATSQQIAAYARRLAEASERVELVEYGRSFEGRPLVYLAVSTPEQLARRDEIQDGMARLADARESGPDERERLIAELPAVAWLGYSIHGNESSGSDAALAVAYHLAADRSPDTRQLLDELVVIIDPNMNPDGRARFIDSVRQARGAQPDVDDQSLVHSGYWPSGRGNHYLFDLNRDWLYARQPETRGRIPHVIDWKPMLFVDIHEMGSQDSYLFSPPRKPHNPYLPPYRADTAEIFADEQAAAFDAYGYPYYSGEWNENWFPGYSDAWAALRGAQGILYEQARIADDGVQQATRLVSYRQSVHHQMLSTFANLETLRDRHEAMLADYAADRARLVSTDGPFSDRSFVVPPSSNQGRINELLELLAIQEIETHRLTESVRISRATDRLGREARDLTLPAGSIVIRNRQPAGRLVAAMFAFDPHMSQTALETERESILKGDGSTIYDTTGWNIPMMFDIETWSVPEHLTGALERIQPQRVDAERLEANDQTIALVASGADDRSVALAARLLERGLAVRANTRASELDGIALPVGSIAVTRDDNRRRDGWKATVREAAAELGLAVRPIGHGRAPGRKADLGGGYWRVLERPKIALLGRGRTNPYDFGSVWYLLDHRLGIRSSQLDETRAGWRDLRRYNVIYLPDRWGALPEGLKSELESWVRAGGTLIAADASARALTQGDEPLVATRTLTAVIGEDLSDYQETLYREWLAADDPLPESIWGHAAPDALDFPWDGVDEALPAAEERERRDAWQRRFMPSGALVGARADAEHWLASGAGDELTVLFSNSPVLMSEPPVEAPVRVGVPSPAEDAGARLVGWGPVPEGTELRVRAGGLLWPEARQRIANAAWLTRQSLGEGQVILFAFEPAFRAAQLGAMRLLENALIYGPGLGADQPIGLP